MNKIITTSILILLFLFQGVAAQNTYQIGRAHV